MTTKPTSRRPAAAMALAALALQLAPMTAAHAPDPGMPWPLFAANDVLEFRWMAGEVPPAAMRNAVVAAAAGAAASRGSRAPTMVFAAGGQSTVELNMSGDTM